MNIWHDTPDAPRTPRRVSATQTVELTIGTWPIGPGQSVWIVWACVGAIDAPGSGSTRFATTTRWPRSPPNTMCTSWQALLRGFTWISWSSFLLGLVESYGYGWYVALIWVPLYNVLSARAAR